MDSRDIAAQRAMLARGEEQRKADWLLAERERLRDTFAAAALTGYTANPAWDDVAASIVAEQSYADADAMLRARSRTGQAAADTTPQSRAGTTSQSYEESNEKRANATMDRDTTPSEGSVHGKGTLTDEERAAIMTAADLLIGSKPGSVLRSLLKRLK